MMVYLFEFVRCEESCITDQVRLEPLHPGNLETVRLLVAEVEFRRHRVSEAE